MKKIAVILFLQMAGNSDATTVLLTVTGRVSSTTVGDFFTPAPIVAGDQWTLRLQYEHPSAGIPTGAGVISYTGIGALTFEVRGLFWTGQGFVGTFSDDFPRGDEVIFSTNSVSPPPLFPAARKGDIVAKFDGALDMVTDASSLPNSFSQWNLPSSSFDLSLATYVGSGFDLWGLRANSFDTISIQVIPEPSAAGLCIAAVLPMARRRRRVAA